MVPLFLRYQSRPIKVSDHRPVEAIIEFQVPVSVEQQRTELAAELTRKSAEFRRIEVPTIVANHQRFAIAETVEVVITNRSVCIAMWNVHEIPDGVVVEPVAGQLVPGQSIAVAVRFARDAREHKISFTVADGLPLVVEFVSGEFDDDRSRVRLSSE
jgi:hypothetical protein